MCVQPRPVRTESQVWAYAPLLLGKGQDLSATVGIPEDSFGAAPRRRCGQASVRTERDVVACRRVERQLSAVRLDGRVESLDSLARDRIGGGAEGVDGLE